LNANYDWLRWTNFYGLGNETHQVSDNKEFYRLRSQNAYVSIGVKHKIGSQSSFNFFPFFQTVKLINDKDRFLVKDFLNGNSGTNFTTKQFAGVGALVELHGLDNELIPTRGIRLTADASYIKNINQSNHLFKYGGDLHLYIPILKNLALSVENGAASVAGEPEFYQLNAIGGRKLRGYRRDRFWGETVFHNNNELQYLVDIKSFLFKGKAGIVGFADQGRVWLKGEHSSIWHYGYGGGIILCPFNKAYISVMYGLSKESNGIVHLDFRRSLK